MAQGFGCFCVSAAERKVLEAIFQKCHHCSASLELGEELANCLCVQESLRGRMGSSTMCIAIMEEKPEPAKVQFPAAKSP